MGFKVGDIVVYKDSTGADVRGQVVEVHDPDGPGPRLSETHCLVRRFDIPARSDMRPDADLVADRSIKPGDKVAFRVAGGRLFGRVASLNGVFDTLEVHVDGVGVYHVLLEDVIDHQPAEAES